MSKRFINASEDVISEMISGVVNADPTIKRVKGHNILVRADYEEIKGSEIAVVSGGGSGHEPAMGGFVGSGMLTAAVAGGVFASPSVASILAAIRTVTGPRGCLLVIMNYTGDRLNFGMAAEQAKAEGLQVEMVVVADDCALSRSKGITGRRGVAGTCFVLKTAGAAALAGCDLETVREEANRAAESIGTLGVALTTCTLPGCPPSDRLDDSTIEVGLGIHGEPGMQQRSPCPAADDLVNLMIETVVRSEDNYLPLASGDQLALLINNLGAVPPMEMHILARRAIEALDHVDGTRVVRVFVGTFMTSLDMFGVSITVMRVSGDQLSRLDAPARCAGWRPAEPRDGATLTTDIAAPEDSSKQGEDKYARPVAMDADAERLERGIRVAAEACISAEPQLTEWDGIAGDGDCGITAKRGGEQILKDCTSHYPLDDGSATLLALADSVSSSMGGTSGALYEIALRSASSVLSRSPNAWGEAFCAGVDAIKFYGGAEAGYRTMLDSLLPAAEVIRGGGGATQAAEAAEAGADSTSSMVGLAGRANYVPDETLRGVPDPGAKAAAFMLRAVAGAL